MIRLNDLSVNYSDEIVALDHITLSLQKGCNVIIGKNGSGKSTLLQTIVGIVDKQGEVVIDDIELNKENVIEIRKRVGLVFQNPDHQLFMSSIYNDLAFGLINLGYSKQEIEEKIEKISKDFSLDSYLNRSSHKLSGGQKRMAALASVLIMEPSIILMDEPTSFLDPKSRRTIINLIKSLDKMTLIATHDLDMALDIADQIILINDGKIVKVGKPLDILKDKKLLEENDLELPYRYQE